uniref:Musashi RNA binding protein 2 n=1 Tax=Amazona collaria TaxID=241587 RepID=A0A8B9G1I1_9PSIT
MEADGSQATSGSPGEAQHDPGKMFIGGLSWQTSPDSLRDYFSKFGEIRQCMVMRDPTTKRSRGFGFVTFADPASVDKVLAQPHHELDSKTVGPCVGLPARPSSAASGRHGDRATGDVTGTLLLGRSCGSVWVFLRGGVKLSLSGHFAWLALPWFFPRLCL